MANEFIMMRRVHFSETDRAGVLYFAHYYRFMEEAEHAFRRSRGLRVIEESDGCEATWPRVATSCEFFAPARFEDELELVFKIVRVGHRSVTSEVEFRLEGKRIALGKMTAAYCRIVGGEFQTAPIPELLRRELEG